MRILILGAYGFIGLPVSRHLLNKGHELVGLARSRQKAEALLPEANWHIHNLADLNSPSDWTEILQGVDAVVNAAGVLQDGIKDQVRKVQVDAISALIQACEIEGIGRYVQISATGTNVDSDTEFFRTKAEADAVLQDSTLSWVILRPGLVIGPHSYGGTTLIRTLASVPLVQPLVVPDAPIQTVVIDDVVDAVAFVLENNGLKGGFDLVEPNPQRLDELVLCFRRWQGFKPPLYVVHLPRWLGLLCGRVGDLLGWFGWRPALRTTALKVLAKGVKGDPGPWLAARGTPLKSLEQSLNLMPSTLQERVFARSMLVFPFALFTLVIFWILSGIIGLSQQTQALAVLDNSIAQPWASAFVIGGSLIDIAIGTGLLIKSKTRLFCLLSTCVALAYLGGSAFFTPWLWLDPLGPMIKVLPVFALTATVAVLAEDR